MADEVVINIIHHDEEGEESNTEVQVEDRSLDVNLDEVAVSSYVAISKDVDDTAYNADFEVGDSYLYNLGDNTLKIILPCGDSGYLHADKLLPAIFRALQLAVVADE